jgi:succinoglycan biosynthesis protein ExoM
MRHERALVRTAVCVATYQRTDGLQMLLESLVAQRGMQGRFLIIVIDNDPDGSAQHTVERFKDTNIPIHYEVEPEPGIPAARNRSVAMARELGVAQVAFIDDDEVASPYWLATMTTRLELTGASAVSGPVEPIFPDDAPLWASSTRLYHRATFADGAALEFASTANSLLKLDAIAGIREPFDRSLQFTGGSDTFLYRSLRQRGGTIIWEPAGLVYEHVPADRLSMRWITRRSYRQGVTLGLSDRRLSRGFRGPLTRAIRGLAQFPIGLIITGVGLIRRDDSWRRGITRIARGAGVMVGLSGRTFEEYKRD